MTERRRWPRSLDKPLLVVFAVALLVLIVFIFPTIIKSFASVYGTYGLISALILVLLSIGTGYLLGGPDPAYRHTLSIATALRNIGLAALVANADFAGTLVGASVMTYFFIQFILADGCGQGFRRQDQGTEGARPGRRSSIVNVQDEAAVPMPVCGRIVL